MATRGALGLACFIAVASATIGASRGVCQDTADEVLERIVENWRWSYYWFGENGVDDVYSVGKRVSMLVFWTKNEIRPIRGICSTELLRCVAYSGVYFEPFGRRMEMTRNSTPHQAFLAFVNSGFRDAAHVLAIEGLKTADFLFEEKSIALPAMRPPSSILRREIPAGASRDAERVKRLFGCSSAGAKTRPPGCTGNLVFAYYGAADPYWFVMRSCSMACELRGESVEMLTRGDHGWEVTSAGFIGGPKATVAYLKHQIAKAAMLRLKM
jgi:hypothetical protein